MKQPGEFFFPLRWDLNQCHSFNVDCGPQSLLSDKGFGKISVQPHTTLCIQFLDRENNEKTIHCHWENRFVLQWHGAVWKFYQGFLSRKTI